MPKTKAKPEPEIEAASHKKKKRKKTGYKVAANGEYVTGTKERKPYKFEVTLPSQEAFLSVIKNNFSHNALFMKPKYPDWSYTRLVYASIIQDEGDRPTRDVNKMSKKQLVEFIKDEDVPINLEIYNTFSKLKQAYKDYKESPEDFMNFQEKRWEKRKGEIRAEQELLALNPDLELENENESLRTELESESDDLDSDL